MLGGFQCGAFQTNALQTNCVVGGEISGGIPARRRRYYIMPDGRIFEATTEEVIALLQLYARPKDSDVAPSPLRKQAKQVNIKLPQITLTKRDIRFIPAQDTAPDTWKVVIAERFIYAPPAEATRQAEIIANRMRADEEIIITLLM